MQLISYLLFGAFCVSMYHLMIHGKLNVKTLVNAGLAKLGWTRGPKKPF